MARTYEQIRQLTIRQTGMRWVTGTADAGGSRNVLRDAVLARYGDDYWNGHHVLLTSGSPTYTELYIHDFLQADGDVRFRPSLASGSSPNTLTYELLPFSATDILYSVQDAIQELYDMGFLSRDFWMPMIAGSPIYNADWGYWTGATAVDGWTATTTTIARERASGNLALSETSLLMGTAAGNVALDARYARYLADFKGQTMTFYCWVRTSATSNARIALYDGSTVNYSAYHGGDGDWELLHVELSTNETDTDLVPRLYTAKTDNAYFNMPFIQGGERVLTYPFNHNIMPDGPYEIIESDVGIERDEIASGRGLAQVRQSKPARHVTQYKIAKHHDEDATTQIAILDVSLSRFPPRDGRLLWLRGDGPLTVPSTALSTSNMEVTEGESMLLATKSAINLIQQASSGAPSSAQRVYEAKIASLHRQFAELAAGAGEARDSAIYSVGW
jgi:hypothetical protein